MALGSYAKNRFENHREIHSGEGEQIRAEICCGQ